MNGPRPASDTRLLLATFCLGLLLAGVLGWMAWQPGSLASLGAPDGLRRRFLRLAAAAALTLPVLALLYPGASGSDAAAPPILRWGRLALVAGAVGMPALLLAAALASPRLKYLLPLPADAVFGGTLVAAWWTPRRVARPPAGPLSRLEVYGWRLVAMSMALGLLMGTFAFEGPLPAAAFLDGYGDHVRRLIRQAHGGSILLGLAGILAGRIERPRGVRRLACGVRGSTPAPRTARRTGAKQP
jgi:hypothetical protein